MKQRTLKAALFDLDGVVFDTEPQYTVFWGSICRQYHPEHPGLEHEIKGQTLTQIYDRWFSGDLEGERASVTERLDAYEQQMTYDFIAGFEALIAELRGKGVKVFSEAKPTVLSTPAGAILRGQELATAPSDGIALISSKATGNRALRCPAVIQYCRKGEKVRAPTSDAGGLKVTFFPFIGKEGR